MSSFIDLTAFVNKYNPECSGMAPFVAMRAEAIIQVRALFTEEAGAQMIVNGWSFGMKTPQDAIAAARALVTLIDEMTQLRELARPALAAKLSADAMKGFFPE